MFFIVFLALGVLCTAEDVDNRAEQGKVTFNAMDDNPYMTLLKSDDGYPEGIQYLQPIDADTGLMVRVIFGDENGPFDAVDAQENMLNICEILNNSLLDPESSQARYNMASHFGMTGLLCPIEPGVKTVKPYELPVEVMMTDFGCGDRYYQMRVEPENGTLESEAIMELRVDLDLTNDNETCTENSSGILSAPSVIVSIVTGVLAVTFTH